MMVEEKDHNYKPNVLYLSKIFGSVPDSIFPFFEKKNYYFFLKQVRQPWRPGITSLSPYTY